MKTAIQIVLAAAILFLGYLLYESIMNPIRFVRERQRRENVTIQRLKDIRTAEIAFKSEYDRYTGDFDSLITFLKSGSFSVVKAIGSAPDSLIEAVGKKEAELIALKKGLIQRDTIQISVIDSLFYIGYPVDSLRYVPYCDGITFNMNSGELLTSSNLTVQVVEAYCLYDDLLNGMDPQLVVNYKDERMKIVGFEGVKFGSMDEGTLTGNWE